jgi:iron(III) transport system ATP-binding protein
MLKATIPGVFLPKAGTPLWLSLRRDRCFVFPCRAQKRVASAGFAAGPGAVAPFGV